MSREYNRYINTGTRWAVFHRDKFTCQTCGKTTPEARILCEHKRPLNTQAGNNESNLTTTCTTCVKLRDGEIPKGAIRSNHTSKKVSRAYRKWSSMIRRCSDPKHPSHHRYGGRGITVCDRWTGQFRGTGFSAFLADMGEPPPGLTIDRINNNGNYEPGNCRWATWKEQASNRTKCGPEINPNSLHARAKLAGLPYMVVYLRVNKLGWTVERALSTPKAKRGRGKRSIVRKMLEEDEAAGKLQWQIEAAKRDPSTCPSPSQL